MNFFDYLPRYADVDLKTRLSCIFSNYMNMKATQVTLNSLKATLYNEIKELFIIYGVPDLYFEGIVVMAEFNPDHTVSVAFQSPHEDVFSFLNLLKVGESHIPLPPDYSNWDYDD